MRLAFQLSVVLFVAVALTGCLFYSMSTKEFELIILSLLILWTLWLLFFTQVLVATHGEAWTNRTTVETLQHLAAYSRLSLMILFALLFLSVGFSLGFLEAQLQLTFFSVIIPMQYVVIYILSVTLLSAGPSTVVVGVPLSFLFSVCVTSFSQTGGNGSIFLVTVHCFSKVVQFFGESELPFDMTENGYDEYHVDLDSTDEVEAEAISQTQQVEAMTAAALTGGLRSRNSFSSNVSLSSASAGVRRITTPTASTIDLFNMQLRPGAQLMIRERGQQHSSLVSLNLSPSINSHWAVKACKQNLSFLGNVLRSVAVTDSLLSSIMRIAAFILATVAFLICSISIASVAQQSLKLFPQLISYHRLEHSNAYHFDHRIANLTLYPVNSSTSSSASSSTCSSTSSTCTSDKFSNDRESFYAACDWSWKGFSLLDFSILSELAYFDEMEKGQLRAMISDLFPSEKFITIKESISDARLANGPLFLEVSTVDVHILAVRGTDVGRLRDFMEDAKAII